MELVSVLAGAVLLGLPMAWVTLRIMNKRRLRKECEIAHAWVKQVGDCEDDEKLAAIDRPTFTYLKRPHSEIEGYAGAESRWRSARRRMNDRAEHEKKLSILTPAGQCNEWQLISMVDLCGQMVNRSWHRDSSMADFWDGKLAEYIDELLVRLESSAILREHLYRRMRAVVMQPDYCSYFPRIRSALDMQRDRWNANVVRYSEYPGIKAFLLDEAHTFEDIDRLAAWVAEVLSDGNSLVDAQIARAYMRTPPYASQMESTWMAAVNLVVRLKREAGYIAFID